MGGKVLSQNYISAWSKLLELETTVREDSPNSEYGVSAETCVSRAHPCLTEEETSLSLATCPGYGGRGEWTVSRGPVLWMLASGCRGS